MGITISDVVTSFPSTWGATNAASAAAVYPLAALVAVPLAMVVSDPAQMWHAGDRYGHVADLIRTANSEIILCVDRHASADKWNEIGKSAFLANRVRPYQDTLDEAARMYDHMGAVLRGCSVGYTAAGVSSAVIGSTLLMYVEAQLATAALPGANVAAIFATNERMAQTLQVVRSLIQGLARVNERAAIIISELNAKWGRLWLPLAIDVGLTAWGAFEIGTRAKSRLDGERVTLHWPERLAPGATTPAGYRAPSAAAREAIKRISPESIKALGKDLDKSVGHTLSEAYDQACGNDVGYPGFSVFGMPIAHAHTLMRQGAADQLAACRDTPGTWLPGLRTNAGNWVFAEEANVDATRYAK